MNTTAHVWIFIALAVVVYVAGWLIAWVLDKIFHGWNREE